LHGQAKIEIAPIAAQPMPDIKKIRK